MKLKEIENSILDCNECKRLRECSPFPFPHVFYTKKKSRLKVMVIARNPGNEHNYKDIERKKYIRRYKKRFWGSKLSRYLREVFTDDFVKDKMYFTNVCKCPSPENSALERKEIDNCSKFLEMQIRKIRPKVIICFGSDASNEVSTIKGKFKKMRIQIFGFYHPSYFQRWADKEKRIEQEKRLEIVRRKINAI